MLRGLLNGLARRGKIILYSSHVLEVVEKVCSQVLILRQGEVVAYDSITQLRELMQQPSLEGVFAQLMQIDDEAEMVAIILRALGEGLGIGILHLRSEQPRLLPVPGDALAPEIAEVLSMSSLVLICEYQSPAPSIVAELTWSPEVTR